jgi:proton glutamate symport protein
MRNLMMIFVALGLGGKRHWHIFAALILGAALGVVFPYSADHYSFLHDAFELVGELFIQLVAMLGIPLIISSLLLGIYSLGDGRQLGKLGFKTLAWFIVLMVLSASVAALVFHVIQPGLNVHPQDLETGIHALPIQMIPTKIHSLRDLILNLVPENFIGSLSRRDLVPVVIFTILLGSAMVFVGETARPFIAFWEAVFAATMRIVDWVMVFAVPGIFALTFTAVSHSGLQLFLSLKLYMASVLIALGIQMLVVFPIILFLFARVSFLDLYRAISEALLVAFGTASSSATLPITMACMERRAGVSNRVASFVLPVGVSMNMNGTTIFEVIAVMFLCQIFGVHLDLGMTISIMLLAIVASIGAAGVPSTGLITISIILNGIGHYELMSVGVPIILAVDRILDMCRTMLNVTDDCVVACIVASNEGELNRQLLSAGETWEDVV